MRNVYRSVFRYGKMPQDAEGQSLAVFNSLFLHIHPVKVQKRTLKLSTTLDLRVIVTVLFAMLTLTSIGLILFRSN